MAKGTDTSWTVQELESELRKFESALRDAGFKEGTLHNYVDRANRFVKWLAGDYRPTTPS
jgi:hypothetical protein